MKSFAFVKYGVCFCEAIWVAAGVRQPVDFKAEMQPIYLLQTFSRIDFKADVKPLYLLQTQTRDSLKVERHHSFTHSSRDASLPVVSPSSVNVSLLSRKNTASLPLLSFASGSTEKPEIQPSLDAISLLNYGSSQRTLSSADAEFAENMLESFKIAHGTSTEAMPLLDRVSAPDSARSTERSMFFVHVVLTIVVVIGVMFAAMVSVCNARTEKYEDARAILDHISKTAVPERPVYGSTTSAPQPLYSDPFEPLCTMPELQQGTSFMLPDLARMKDGIVSFDIVSGSGEIVLEGVINNEAKDAGILLQQPTTNEAAGAAVAFVSTSRAALAFGNIPIVRPSVDRPQGDHFGILKRIAMDKYSVVRKNRTVMVIEGPVAEQCLTIHTALADSSKGSQNAIGSTQPCSDKNGQRRLELHAGCGVDSGLAIICLLTIIRLEAARAAST